MVSEEDIDLHSGSSSDATDNEDIWREREKNRENESVTEGNAVICLHKLTNTYRSNTDSMPAQCLVNVIDSGPALNRH